MKKTIAILVMFVMLGSISVFAVSSQGIPTFEDLLSYQPPGGTSGCTNSRLLYEDSGVLDIGGRAYRVWGQIPVNQGCNYRVEACGTTIGEGHGDVLLWIVFQDEEDTIIRIPVDVGEVRGTECASFYWNVQQYGMPIGVEISWGGGDAVGTPSLQYNFKIYEECSCSLPTLYPKVDIEQFSVAGGSTIIRDGKILSSFEIAPGVQQTFIQVENRGFFTQNEAMIKFEGLPNGVSVNITPETQKIKAHNLGTYSATFTVDPNVPSGTYQVTLVSYSERGVFDKIIFEFVVP
ncbi:MAG: hypothetical protein GKC00_00640 [Candidatus Methanofastidiosa archaeon]|nr:hypothetical protein [Candidatus Methanofastidiosa archaeon]